MQSGFCFVTFSEHSAPVTAVAFLPSGSVVVSASLDGTVRAFDLVRYRNFRTMTSPHPVQFVSLAVDPAGEVRPFTHGPTPLQCSSDLDSMPIRITLVDTFFIRMQTCIVMRHLYEVTTHGALLLLLLTSHVACLNATNQTLFCGSCGL
jgi:WD40 repeat protein